MSGLGWENELPLDLGGGTTRTEDVYAALRSAVGQGGAGPVDSLEDLWRQSKAQVIAGAVESTERAILQAFPNIATDHIAVYERALAITPPEGATDEERRAVIVVDWTRGLDSRMLTIDDDLQAISPKFRLEELGYDLSSYTLFGRMFPADGDEVAEGIPQYPNYSSEFVIRIVYDFAFGETFLSLETRLLAARLVNSVLPAWVDWVMYTTSEITPAGLYCEGGLDGTSVLDFTQLSV